MQKSLKLIALFCLTFVITISASAQHVSAPIVPNPTESSVAPTAPRQGVTTTTLTGQRVRRIIPTPTRTVSRSTFTTVKFG